MRSANYNKLVRGMAVVVAVFMWLLSIQFSASGFNFQVRGYVFVGYLLGLAVTAIELVFNEDGKGHSMTLVAAGVLAYIYGVGTNIYGIWLAQGSPNIEVNPAAVLMPVVLGVMLEIIPEPLLLWGMGIGARDVIGHLFGDKSGKDQPRTYQSIRDVPRADLAFGERSRGVFGNGGFGTAGRDYQNEPEMDEEQPPFSGFGR